MVVPAGLVKDLAQRRKGAKTVLAGELNLCGLLAVGLLTFVFSTWRRGEETRNNHQAGFAALRSWRENNHWAHRCLLTGIDIITLTYDLATGCTPVRGRGTPLGFMRGAGRRSTERAIALKQLCCVMGVVDQRAEDALLGGDPRRKACGGGGH